MLFAGIILKTLFVIIVAILLLGVLVGSMFRRRR